MAGAPPFAPGARVTLANWQDPPFNRWAFQHVRELIPTARIPRGDGPAWPLPRAERDLGGVRLDITAHAFSVSAREKIAAAGGTVHVPGEES